MAPQTLHFGLLLLPEFQWLDAVGPVDYINTHSYNMVKFLGVPQDVLDKAPHIEWHYISHNLEPVRATTGPLQHPSTTYKECPELDYIVVPGPPPTAQLPEGCAEFLQQRFADPRLKAYLLVCTGSLAVSQSGILDGLHVCSSKYALRMLAQTGQLYRKVHWLGDRRWHVDGKIWSAAGITSGIDLAAEFAKRHFAQEIVELVGEASEYDAKPSQPDTFAHICEGVKLN